MPITRRALLGAALATTATTAAGCDRTNSGATATITTPVTYLTNFGQLGRDAYAYYAAAAGHFTDFDLSVNIEPGTGTVGNLQALAAGQADFAVVDLAGAIMQAVPGDNQFLALAAIQQRPLAAVMTLDPNIATPADLSGRTIAMPPGAVTDLLFPAYATAARINDVEIVHVEPASLVGVLASGQVDAIGQFVVGRPLVEAAANGRPVTVFPYDEYITDLYGVCLFTTREHTKQAPDLCLRFASALLDGLDAALANPAAAAAALAEANPATDPDVAAEELRLMEPYVRPTPGVPLGGFDEERVMKSIGVLQSANAVDRDRDGLHPRDLVAFDLV